MAIPWHSFRRRTQPLPIRHVRALCLAAFVALTALSQKESIALVSASSVVQTKSRSQVQPCGEGVEAPSRRSLFRTLSVGGIFASSFAGPQGGEAAELVDGIWRAQVGGSAEFKTVAAALAAVPGQATAIEIILKPGTFKERVQLGPGPPVTLTAETPGESTIIWETTKPYEATLQLSGGARATVRGVRFKHSSKSVANNFGIYTSDSDLTLENCDVTSSTGAGVAGEGGKLKMIGGSVHDSARQGLVMYGSLLGNQLKAKVEGTSFLKNGNYAGDGDAIRGPFDGVLAQDNVVAELVDVVVSGSGASGIAAQEDETTIVVRGGSLANNKNGPSRTKNGGEVEIKK